MQNVSICDCFFFISGQDSVWAGKIQGFLNLSLRASVAQQELDIVDQMWVRQGPRFSIRMVIGIFCFDTETGAATPPGVMQKK